MRKSIVALAALFYTPWALVSIWIVFMAGLWPAIKVWERFGDAANMWSAPVLVPWLWAESGLFMCLIGAALAAWIAPACLRIQFIAVIVFQLTIKCDADRAGSFIEQQNR